MNAALILAKPSEMFKLGRKGNGRHKAMAKEILVLLLIAALLWLAGCATTGVSDRSAAFGTCTSMMDARYCGP
ncbi:MAG TPA: hypothetical protein DEO88_03960 [Syntrophobacteraceae bacterium]|nr:hypothetical protein [Syntrophobacteraceae bacterium]